MIDIITIAFNNLDILKIQSKFLYKNLRNSYKQYIVDNSTNNIVSQQILQFCKENNIFYIKTNILNTDFSVSHGLALNFSINNIDLTGEYILILDHDIIPIINIDILKNNECTFYGLKQQRQDKWYIWPGFFMFKNIAEIKRILNFLPCPGLDSGGSNYSNIFSKISEKEYTNVKEFYYCSLIKSIDNLQNNNLILEKSLNNIEYDYWHKNNDMFEYIDGWIHFINTSNWNNKGNKMDKIINFTNLLLTKNIN
jgi:hypothetical protein